MKLLKYKIPDSIEKYCSIRIKADKEGYIWTNDILGYMIFEEKKKRAKTEKPNIDDTILYEENRNLWKSWQTDLKEKYREFRYARFQKWKDYVSPYWEKKIINIINKYPKRVSLALIENSFDNKSVFENLVIIDREMKAIQEENARITERLEKQEAEKHKEEVMTAKQQRDEKIRASWESYEYWEKKARELIRIEKPTMKEEFMWPLIPTYINKLLDNI